MKTLLLLRHAKAEPAEEDQHDHARPLAKRGRRDAPRVGEYIVEHALVPDIIFSSSALRARETAELVANAIGYQGQIAFHRELYMAGPAVYADFLQRAAAEARSILVVGHNPGLEALVHELTSRFETLATATLAVIDAPIAYWRELRLGEQCELREVVRPKEI